MVFACTRRDADEEPPPPPRIATTIDTDGLPTARVGVQKLLHYIDLTRPPTPHQQMRLISRNKPVTARCEGIWARLVVTNGLKTTG